MASLGGLAFEPLSAKASNSGTDFFEKGGQNFVGSTRAMCSTAGYFLDGLASQADIVLAPYHAICDNNTTKEQILFPSQGTQGTESPR